MDILYHWNYALFLAINGLAGAYAWLDSLMAFCADYLIFCWPILLLLIWGLPLAWKQRTLSSAQAALLQRRRSAVLWVPIACLIAYGLNLFIELFVFEPRPFVTHHNAHLLISHAADSAFPSDHTAWSFAVFGVLLFILVPALFAARRGASEDAKVPKGEVLWQAVLVGVAFVVACSIGFARVFVGVHYPGDVLGGALDGLVAGAIAALLFHVLRRLTDIVLRFARQIRLA
ncbi:MAG: phosphatase PAP2 family protein [Chloroflexota bacterium]|nr:phosphatase PAP2 family protein [Chloroflexota bacterium]